jgi:hypothetical protein
MGLQTHHHQTLQAAQFEPETQATATLASRLTADANLC